MAGGTIHEGAAGPAFGLQQYDPLSTNAPASAANRRRPAHGGVESWASTASDVEAWLDNARPGDRFVYAKGPSLVQGAAAALVGRLCAAREVSAHNRRAADGVLEYLIIRNAPKKVVRPPVCTPHMMAVLMVLQDAAENRERCPSNEDIGEATGLSKGQVKAVFDKLEDARFIERRTVPTPSDARFRVVKVLATGAETAGPQGGAA